MRVIGFTAFYLFCSTRPTKDLESSPPDVVVGLLRGIIDKLTARVEWSLGEDVGQISPDSDVRDLDTSTIPDVDAKASGVVAARVDAGRKPESVLTCMVNVRFIDQLPSI